MMTEAPNCVIIHLKINNIRRDDKMKEEYVLYLDESEFKNSNTFCIAGIAVKKSQINFLQQGIMEAKRIIWTDEYIKEHNPVLHCTELQKVYVKRGQESITDVKEEYCELIKCSAEEIEKAYEQLYGKLSQLIKKSGATVFSCIIKVQQLRDLFYIDESHNGIHLIDDKYNIALQKVIENYTHYLSVCDGYGDVIYESRNTTGENSAKSPDIKLINAYHKIQANSKGIVYTDSAAVQSRNRTIVAFSKSENLAGLEIADFVAYNILKFEACTVEQQVTDFMKQIHRLSYNGGHKLEECDQRSFWGLRVLPSYLQMENLIRENKKLKNAYSSLRKEKNKLKKQLEKDTENIDEQKRYIEQMEEEIKRLKSQLANMNTEH